MTPGEQRMWLMHVPGMNQGMLNAMMKGTRRLEEMAAAARKAGAADDEGVKVRYGTAASATSAIERGIAQALQPGMPPLSFGALLGKAGVTKLEPDEILRKITAYLEQKRTEGMAPEVQRWWIQQIPGMTPEVLYAMMKGTRGLEEMGL
jgi:hypothetical protein